MALQARGEVESASRKPEMLEHFMAKAAKEHSRAGPNTVSRRRRGAPQAVGDKRLIEYGRMRARTLGLARRLHVHEGDGRARGRGARARARPAAVASCGRSIIESALEHPFPGWIDGFKMADPIIRAYGMGQIPEFPGIPEGIIDLIPVDYVVNAILAVAANPPPAGEPAHYNVSGGDRNPLRFFELYEYVREYFESHPLPERGRGEHKVPDVGLPRQPQGREDAAPRRDVRRPRGEGRDAHAEVQGDARRGQPRRSRQGARRLHQALLRPLRHVHRDRGRLHRRPRTGVVGQSDRGGQGALPVRRRRWSTGSTTCRTCTRRR